jgi:preprotein translocase subunit SecE
MEKVNSKILTVSFASFGALCGVTLSILLRSFSGAFALVARALESDLVRHGLPVLVGFVVFAVLQFNPKVMVWGEEVVTEVRKVVWPSRKDTLAMTIAVCIMVLISSVIIGVFDLFSGYLINFLVK